MSNDLEVKIPMNNVTPVQKLHEIAKELNSVFINREEVVKLIHICWIAQINMLITGKPGTAKTAIVSAASSHIEDGRHFEVLLSKFSDPGEAFGAWDFGEMQKGNQVRNLDWGVVPCFTATVDEVGKASTAILNTLLPVMNERIYYERGRRVNSDLFSVFGCSNELPNSPELSALFDRFHIRYNVERLDKRGFGTFIRSPKEKYAPSTTITLDELRLLQEQVPADPSAMISAPIFDMIEKLWDKLGEEGFEASDRRWGMATRLMCAHAIYEGRAQVTDDDLNILQHVLWEDPKDQFKIKVVISQVGDPMKAKAAELLDTAVTLHKEFLAKHGTTKGTNVVMDAAALITAIKGQIEEASDLITNNPGANHQRLRDTIEKLKDLKEEVSSRYL